MTSCYFLFPQSFNFEGSIQSSGFASKFVSNDEGRTNFSFIFCLKKSIKGCTLLIAPIVTGPRTFGTGQHVVIQFLQLFAASGDDPSTIMYKLKLLSQNITIKSDVILHPTPLLMPAPLNNFGADADDSTISLWLLGEDGPVRKSKIFDVHS